MSNNCFGIDVTKLITKNVKHLPLVLCEDISGSMLSKCDLMNKELNNFFSFKQSEPELSTRINLHIIQFNDVVSEPIDTKLNKYNFKPFSKAQMNGTTHFWEALNKGISICEKYIDNPHYWTPWLLVYTDGIPNGDPDGLQSEVINRLRHFEENNDIFPFFLGIGDSNDEDYGLDIEFLSGISKHGRNAVAYALNETIDIKRFFNFMMRTIIATMSSTSYFFVDDHGRRKLNIDLLYNEYAKYQDKSRIV